MGLLVSLLRSAQTGSYERFIEANVLASGEETWPRFGLSTTAFPTNTQRLQLTYFTARKTETIASLGITTGGTAAGATPTVCRMGVYEIAANGDGTLVGSTANDTALFAAAATAYVKALSASFTKNAGQRYAFGLLVVSGATMPTFHGNSALPQGYPTVGGSAAAPRLAGSIGSQTDLPSSFAAASVTNTNAGPLLAVLVP